ncbi:MAG: hypothetical protein ACOC2R_00945 [Spirochaetota bacterium]
MKREFALLKAVGTVLLFIFFVGCMSAPSGLRTADASEESAPEAAGEEKPAEVKPADESTEEKTAGADWKIELSGVRSDAVSAQGFAEAKEHSSHYREMNDFMAMPFWYLVAMVDGEDSRHPWLFDEEAWQAGYDITLTASDGYAVTFSTKDVAADALYLADQVNGEMIPPRIVGDVSSKLQLKDLAKVELALGESAVQKTFELELEINGDITAFTREELEATPYYMEGTGSYTTSAGTTHTHEYGGVKFADFLRSYVDLSAETSVKVVAMDGYSMSYSGGDLMDESDGTWILAFKSDGEYLPLDPGYIRSLKVGPSQPNIDGHSSARMIKKVIVSGEEYKEYELLIRGRMENVLDRQTIQSGVSCHEKTVAYYDRKSGQVENYTGIPLWMLLAFGDDAEHAPHRQTDKEILSYKQDVAQSGYAVKIVASDGYSVTLDSRQLDKNDEVIIATQKEGETLPEREWPMILVWDRDADRVPEGIKAVRNITEIQLLFD